MCTDFLKIRARLEPVMHFPPPEKDKKHRHPGWDAGTLRPYPKRPESSIPAGMQTHLLLLSRGFHPRLLSNSPPGWLEVHDRLQRDDVGYNT